MRNFLSVEDAHDPLELASNALQIKANPFGTTELGKNKTLGLLFLNPSLRTRLTTQKAAHNLGLSSIVLNLTQEGWPIETKDIKMDGHNVEHIKDAARVMGQNFEILGVRSFARLTDRKEDENDELIKGLITYSGVPVISLESATLHPLQSLADLMTIMEAAPRKKPPVTLLWAPHVKPLPQAVANSFAQWMLRAGYPLTIAAPKGYELDSQYTQGARIVHSKREGIGGAQFVYAKNWSRLAPYGSIQDGHSDWMVDSGDLRNFPEPYFMHCLPVRRDLELSSAVLDSQRALVSAQSLNRIYAAQAVLTSILKGL